MKMTTRALRLPVNQLQLVADLHLPATAVSLVVFVHGSGSGRLSPRNQQVAEYFNQRHLATLLFDLLSEEEQPSTGFADTLALPLSCRWGRGAEDRCESWLHRAVRCIQ